MGDGEWTSVKFKFESQDLQGSIANARGSRKGANNSLAASLERATLEDSHRWEIDPKEIEVGRKLGKGAFGTVYKGTLRGKDVAIKKLHVQQFEDDALEDFRAEVEIMSKLRHPNVVLFMGSCFAPGNYMMVTELMPKGSVYDLLRDKSLQLSFKRRMKMAKDSALGMNWLHCSKPVFIHRDLKTQNLLVDENWTVKVADFGLSHIKKQEKPGSVGSYGAIGTPLWMAPEVLQNKPYDESADVYSFGIVLWELLTQQEPFTDIETFSTMVETVVSEQKRPEIPADCPEKLKGLINACWDPEPRNRPTFADIIPQFDEIIVDGIITDKIGCKMWKKYFMKDKLRETVSWRNFVIALTTIFNEKMPNSNDIKWQCLKTLVADDQEKVSMESFARTLEWFGPLKSLSGLLNDIESLLKQEWFHGDISSTDAEKKLGKEKKGTYLVRFSARDPGCYAISTVSKGGRIKHYRVYHKPGLDYLIGKIECDSLDSIVTKYAKELYLISPCPGSPFQDLFYAKKNVSAGYLVPELE